MVETSEVKNVHGARRALCEKKLKIAAAITNFRVQLSLLVRDQFGRLRSG